MIHVLTTTRFDLASCALRRANEALAKYEVRRYHDEMEAFRLWMDFTKVDVTRHHLIKDQAYWNGFSAGVDTLSKNLEKSRALAYF